jgi:hypothetical protein
LVDVYAHQNETERQFVTEEKNLSQNRRGLRIVTMKGGWQNRGDLRKREGMPSIEIDRHVRASDSLFHKGIAADVASRQGGGRFG